VRDGWLKFWQYYRAHGYGITELTALRIRMHLRSQVDLLLGRPLDKAQTRGISIQMHFSISRHRSSFVYTIEAVAFAGGQLSQLPSVTYCGLRLNVVKDLKRVNPIVGFREVDIRLVRKRFPGDISLARHHSIRPLDIRAQILGPASSFSHFSFRPAYIHVVLSRLILESCMTPWCCP
jgi:hypothetical protein